MKIGTLAQRSGLSTHTIRYYERIGLLPAAHRDDSGHRRYDDATLVWVEFLLRLKQTGMPLREMQRYAHLRSLGVQTEHERRVLLEHHADALRARIAGLSDNLVALNHKINGYAQREKDEGT